MLAIVGVVLLVIAVALYASRKIIAREALTGWLESRGIASEAEVQAFGLTGFTGRLRVGDPNNPDLTAERAEVTYALRGLRVEVRSVKLVKPVLKASFRGGKLSAGVLDPLIDEFRRRPPQPDARKPRIEIEDGLLLLATDYGALRVSADAVLEDGRLVTLSAASAPTRIQVQDAGIDAGVGAARLRVVSRSNRLDATLDAPIRAATTPAAAVRNGRLRVAFTGPYPDLEKKRGEGPVVLRANLTGEQVSVGGQRLGSAQISAAFDGRTTGWIDTLAVKGRASADLRASSGDFGPASAEGLRVAASATEVSWTRRGGDAVSARLKFNGTADAVAAQDLRLQRVRAAFSGPLTVDGDGASVSLSGGANGHGGWSGLGAPVAGDSREIVAVKRGVRSFAFQAPGVALSYDRGPMRLAILQPISLRPDAGGLVRLAPRDDDYRLTMAGGGLPQVDAYVTRFALQSGGATVGGRAKAGLSIGPVERGVFDVAGTVRIGDGVKFTADRCTVFSAAKLELGENDVEGPSGRLCPDGRPMLELGKGRWTLAGRAQGAAGAVPFLQARVTEGSGRIVLGQASGRLHLTAAVSDALVADAAPKTRFYPVRMAGRALLARERWTADLAFRTPAGAPVATARLEHLGLVGSGGVDIDTGALTFADGGLQPRQLSPLAEALGPPVTGSARFRGGFRWIVGEVTSSGVVDIPRLDFASPAGRVTGLSGQVAFTSLAPLIAAPGQQLRAEAVDAALPLTNVTATFALQDEVLRISGGEAAVGGGRVLVESLEVPLDPKQPTKGVAVFEGVQLHDIVEASPFGDRMELDAKVSGRVPFEVTGQQVRVRGGSLRAIQPGRISIHRAALTSVAAEGAVETPAGAPTPEATTDTFTDFAYQAMENLAFDKLDATIESRDNDRLGVLFHIVGRHDPPQHQEIKLSIMELIRRDFMNRKLPLPSGVGVDLTLDTSLNLDELLRDYAEYQRLRSSGAVQP
ncbi:intermembrane phospholipid transport protein YdbH family protein [Phenylobacterium sp.]|uniref:intermembrane phospholipid transport protein YdbH family protein n=1 Tax=Phenylobacterium sp. TaxID=1871053 RepID=UPI002F95115A